MTFASLAFFQGHSESMIIMILKSQKLRSEPEHQQQTNNNPTGHAGTEGWKLCSITPCFRWLVIFWCTDQVVDQYINALLEEVMYLKANLPLNCHSQAGCVALWYSTCLVCVRPWVRRFAASRKHQNRTEQNTAGSAGLAALHFLLHKSTRVRPYLFLSLCRCEMLAGLLWVQGSILSDTLQFFCCCCCLKKNV